MLKISFNLLFLGWLLWAGTWCLATELPRGAYAVGFRYEELQNEDHSSYSIGVWYPAKSDGRSLSFQDYLTRSRRKAIPDSTAIKDLASFLNIRLKVNFSAEEFKKVLTHAVRASENVPPFPSKFPLIIALTNTFNHFETFEFLASHGFIVAAVNASFAEDPPSPDGPHHYTRYTDAMETLLRLMQKDQQVSSGPISVLGHGFGINPAIYLAMRHDRIKKVVNFDGGFFGTRSKSQKSSDYLPARLQAEILNFYTTQQESEDDLDQIKAISSRIIHAKVLSDNFNHLDFTSYTRLNFKALQSRRSNYPEIDLTFQEIHEITLAFLLNKQVPATKRIAYTERR